MKSELYIARRFAFKPRSASKPTFIVFIAVAGIAVGTAALILTLSIVKGFSAQIENKLIGFSSHFQLRQVQGGLFYPLSADTLRLKGIENISSVTPFMEKNIVLQSDARDVELIKPAMLKGILREKPPVFLEESIIEGSWLGEPESSSLQILVGKPLAEALQLSPGSRVMIISTTNASSGELIRVNDNIVDLLSSMDIELATVAGIYETGLNEGFDDYMVVADLVAMQRFFNADKAMVSGYEVMVHDLETLNDTSLEAVNLLGYPFYGYTVFERYANLFEWLRLQQNITPLLIITITVVAVFNIISTLLVLIIEKTKEIGMLGALGLVPGKISGIFLSQAFLIALVGIIVGNLLAFGFSVFELHFQLITLPQKNYFIKHIPIQMELLDYVMVSCIVGVLTLVFAFIPARVAASLKPGTALLT
ncbi:MAG: ABC transporter permease [Chlorobiales bacterium]|nr:ABC transporter permease [Chlorobiales bacterium]